MTKIIDLADKSVNIIELIEQIEANGDTFVFERNGQPVAELVAPAPGPRLGDPINWEKLNIPWPDEDFADDLERIHNEQGIARIIEWPS